jgi:S-adenosylmethionine decarboxylase
VSNSSLSGHNYQESENQLRKFLSFKRHFLAFSVIIVSCVHFLYFLANKGIDMYRSLSGQLGDRFLTPVDSSDDPLVRVPASVGFHCILELYDCSKTLLNDADFVRQSLRDAATQAKATLLNEVLHQFEPQGITALALLSESHISIHTWPEVGYAALDVFTCGHHTDPEEACKHMVKAFKAERHILKKLKRNPPPTSLTLCSSERSDMVDELVLSKSV